MMRRGFIRDARGVAALELALIAPVIAAIALVSFEAWKAAGRSADMRAALKTGAQYYMNGGSDDAAARSLAISAWERRPVDGQVTVSRACACGTTAQVCTSLCADSTPPTALVTLRATGSDSRAMFNKSLTEDRVIRVR